MRTGSLFSGYDGLGLAVDELFPGNTREWFCEWDDAPSKILSHHWPTVPNFRDVTEVDWAAIPPVDILTGGYPCQPFSAAGQRKGTDDERHLWPYVRKAIRHLRPRFTLLENVAGHRSMGFDRVLGDCAEDGLYVRWTSVRASDVGACHRRERLFILVADPARIGFDGHTRQDCESVSRGEQSSGPNTDRRGGQNAANTSSAGWTGVDDGTGLEGARSNGQRESGRSAGRTPGPMKLLPTPTTQSDTGNGHARNLGTEAKLLPTQRTSDGTGGPNPLRRHERMDDVETRVIRLGAEWGDYEPAIRRQEALSRPAPAPTMLSRNGNPRLDPLFPEWMMFLPAGHVTNPVIGLPRNDQLKAIGNGVCPPQAVAAYSSLLAQAVAS